MELARCLTGKKVIRQTKCQLKKQKVGATTKGSLKRVMKKPILERMERITEAIRTQLGMVLPV